MASANPDICSLCGSTNTGAIFGFKPQPINDEERLIHDVLFACTDFDGQWEAWALPQAGEPGDRQPPIVRRAYTVSGAVYLGAKRKRR